MQGEVTRDSEGRGSPSEGEFGMGINDEKVFRAHGRRGFKVESEQRDSKLQVRASDPALRRCGLHRSCGRRHAGENHRGKLRRLTRRALPQQRSRPTLRRSQGK